MEKKKRSSILKRASVVPSSPTFTRRISFHEKKSVKEFSEGLDKVTIWHNSYEEEAVNGVSIEKENVYVVNSTQPTSVRVLRSALKQTAPVVPSVQSLQGFDDDMDLTPLGDCCVEENDLMSNDGRISDEPIQVPEPKSPRHVSHIPQLIRPSPHRQSMPMRDADKIELTFAPPPQQRRLTCSDPLNMEISSESLNDKAPTQLGCRRRTTIATPFSMEMTLIEHGTSAQVAYEIEKSIAEMNRQIKMPGLLLFDDEEEEEFYKSIEQMSFDNTSADSDIEARWAGAKGINATTLTYKDLSFDVSDEEGVQKSVAVSQTASEDKLDLTNALEMEKKAVYNRTLLQDKSMDCSPNVSGLDDVIHRVASTRRTVYNENHLDFTALIPDNNTEHRSVDNKASLKPTSRRTVYDDQLDMTAIEPDNKPASVQQSTNSRRTVYEDQLDFTAMVPDTNAESVQIENQSISIVAPVKPSTTRRTVYEEQLDFTAIAPNSIQCETMQLENQSNPNAATSKARQTVYEDQLDFTTISSARMAEQIGNGVRFDSLKDEPKLDIIPETLPVLPSKPDPLSATAAANEKLPPNRTVICDQSIAIDSGETVHSVPLRLVESERIFVADETIGMNMTRMTPGMADENLSLDISDTFNMKRRGLFSSTQIAGSNNALNEDNSIGEPQTKRKSVIQYSQYVHQLHTDERRHFDRTLHQVDAASQSNCIDDVSDSVLISPQIEVSSSMRLFRTNSQETTTSNTTEELCNLNAEQLCVTTAKTSRYDSIRLSGLRQHINVTVSQSDDENELLTDSAAAVEPFPAASKEPAVRLRCSIGTPNESLSDMCRQCPNCQKRQSGSPLGGLDALVERAQFDEPDPYRPLDYGGYEQLNMYATVGDVLRNHSVQMEKINEREESRRGISLNVPSPGIIYLLKNLVEQEFTKKRAMRDAVERPFKYHGVFPSKPDVRILLNNLFESRPSFAWRFDGMFFVQGRLRFIHKQIPSVILYALFDYDKHKADVTHGPITFTAVKTSVCEYSTGDHMTPLNWIRHKELLATLAPEILMSCTSSDHLIAFLERLDTNHYARIYDIGSRLQAIVARNDAVILRQTDGKCFVQKRIFDRERLERQTIVIELVKIEHTCKQHIFTDPMLESKPSAAAELGNGIECVERILSDTYRYLIRPAGSSRSEIGY